jgi:hypothetical protein
MSGPQSQFSSLHIWSKPKRPYYDNAHSGNPEMSYFSNLKQIFLLVINTKIPNKTHNTAWNKEKVNRVESAPLLFSAMPLIIILQV